MPSALPSSSESLRRSVSHRMKTEKKSIISTICDFVNQGTLTEYVMVDHHRNTLRNELNELKSPDKTVEQQIKDIRSGYGYRKRNALSSICVCNPTLEVVKLLVEIGGKKDSEKEFVTEVGNCGFTALHYACWGNASLEVIEYLINIGGKDALLTKSRNGGANPLHITCTRHTSNSLSDVIRLLIKAGKHEIVTATDDNVEIPLQCLLLRPGPLPVESIIAFIDEWYEIEKTGGTVLSTKGPQILQSFTERGIVLSTKGPQILQSVTENQEGSIDKDESYLNNPEEISLGEMSCEFEEAFSKVIRQLLKTDHDTLSQIVKTQFMKEYLTERFIHRLPLAILMLDLYIQVLIVSVFSFFISATTSNPVDSTTIVNILIFCVIWRLLREFMQLSTTTFGNYFNSVSNWLDITQIVLIFHTMNMNLDEYSSNTKGRYVLIFATFFAWFELLFELHNFLYDLAIFVVATMKVIKRLGNFVITLAIFVLMFSHMYFVAGPDDPDLCNERAKYDTQEDFDEAGGFTCKLSTSYTYVFSHLFDFGFPSGVPILIPFAYASVLLILFLNIVIAVVCSAFEDSRGESEMSFWSDRLVIVNELGNIISGIQRLINHNPSSEGTACSDNTLHKSTSNKRYDLHLLLESSVWDNMTDTDKEFIHWWYGKSDETPSLKARLYFFFWRTRIKEMLIPGDVFENILLGYNRSHRAATFEKVLSVPISFILLVFSNAVVVVIFLAGWVSLGLLWPKQVKVWLFSTSRGTKKKITNEKQKKNGEISEMRIVINKMRSEMNDNSKQTDVLISKINSLLEKKSM